MKLYSKKGGDNHFLMKELRRVPQKGSACKTNRASEERSLNTGAVKDLFELLFKGFFSRHRYHIFNRSW